MKRPVNVVFLTEDENTCLELLLKAQDLFDQICAADPQNSTDAYNFGHYLDAARSAIIVRGARRLDPENLLVKHSDTKSSTMDFDKLMNELSSKPILVPRQPIDWGKHDGPAEERTGDVLV